MRGLVSRIAINALSLFLVSLVFSGLRVQGGFTNYLIAGALLTVFSAILDPIIKIITLPFNILTLGLLSFLSTLAALLVLTSVFPKVAVSAFVFTGFSFLGLTIGQIHFSLFLSFVAISATIYFLNKLVAWLFSTR